VRQDSSQPAASAGYEVRIAVSPAERENIFRFRYESFAGEYGRWPDPGLVVRRTIRSEEDDRATLFYVDVEGRVVATIRLRVGHLPEELKVPFEVKRFSAAAGSSMALVDEIFVMRIFRNAFLLESVLEAISAWCQANGVLLLFCHTRPDVVPVYRAARFQEIGVLFEHQNYGPRMPLVRFIGS
jgi:hypothetical protein